MKKLIVASLVVLMAVFTAGAQRVRFNVAVAPDTLAAQIKLYVQPLNVNDEGKTTPLRFKDNMFTGAVPVSDSGFYQVVAVYGSVQMITPFYSGDVAAVSLEAVVEGRSLVVADSGDNKALSRLNSAFAQTDRRLWTEQNLPADTLAAAITGYITAAQAAIAAFDVSPVVADYMNIWAYTRANSAYDFLPMAQSIKREELPFAKADLLPPPAEILNNDLAALFMPAAQMVMEGLPAKASLPEKFEVLYASCKNEPLRAKVSLYLVERFLSQHDYASDFDGGLAVLGEVTEKYGLPEHYVADYLKKKSTIKGAAFPADVVLQNADGDIVDFSSFKGKYVYIDMWASWCAPCCREVPHLQALEASLENSDVVFVSISCDADTGAWKSKMAELGMHGNQLHDKNNSLGAALNVKGIPFFVIYDKEGRLHTYRAMRPSSGDALKQYLENLH